MVKADGPDGEPRELFSVRSEPGEPLRTTLDPRWQSWAEAVLAVPDPKRPGPATALLALRPSDGAVLAAAAMGLGVDHDRGFPAYFGQVPPPRSATEGAADLIGQGRILAFALTMAAVAASAQTGRAVVPHLLAETRPEAEPETPLTAAEAGALRSMMRAVVTEGSGTVLASLPGEPGAKTGTAEYGEPGPDGALRTHGWMIAFQGDLAVAAFVEDGESGSSAAGPLLREFLSN